MKNKNLKKVVLVITSAASSIGSYMFSGAGIAAATLGSLSAVTVFAVDKKKTSDKKKTNKHNEVKKEQKQLKEKTKEKTKKAPATIQKKELRKKITTKKIELKQHRTDLKKLKKAGSGVTPEAQKHTTIIEYLEDDIKNIKRDLRNL